MLDDLEREDVSALIAPRSAFHRERYAVVSGRPLGQRVVDGKTRPLLLPLEPDVLGELYVLDLCAGDADFLDTFRITAWRVQTNDYGRLLARASVHFFDHPSTAALLTPLEGGGPARYEWAQSLPNLIEGFARTGQLEAAATHFDALLAATGKVFVPGKLNRSAHAIIQAAVEDGRFDVAGAVVRAIQSRQLTGGTVASRHGRLHGLLRGTILLVVRLAGERGTPDAVVPIYRDLLDRGQPDEGVVGAGVNLIHHLATAGHLQPAEDIHNRIEGVCRDRGENKAFIRIQAMATLNLATATPDLARKRDLNDRLAEIPDRPGAPASVVTSYAKSCLDIVQTHIAAGEAPNALPACRRLAALAPRMGEDSAPRSLLLSCLKRLAPELRVPADVVAVGNQWRTLLDSLHSITLPEKVRSEIDASTTAVLETIGRGHGAGSVTMAFQHFADFAARRGPAWRSGVRTVGAHLGRRLREGGDPPTAEEIERIAASATAEPDRTTPAGLAAMAKASAENGDLTAALADLEGLAGLVPNLQSDSETARHLLDAAAVVLAACQKEAMEEAEAAYRWVEAAVLAVPDGPDDAAHAWAAAHNMATLALNQGSGPQAHSYFEDARGHASRPGVDQAKSGMAELALRLIASLRRAVWHWEVADQDDGSPPQDLKATETALAAYLADLARANPDHEDVHRRFADYLSGLIWAADP